jgi:hypothetical protein
LDTVIAAILGLVVIGMAVLGGISQVRPPRSQDAVELYVVSFVILGLIGVTMIVWQSHRSQVSERKTQEFQKALVDEVSQLRESSTRVETSLANVTNQLAGVRGAPETSLKRRALQLSADILQFISERNHNEPPLPGPATWKEDTDRLIRYSRETMDLYSQQFGARVIATRNELAGRGLNDAELDRFYEHPTNPIGVRIVGERIGALAIRLQ